MQRVFDVVFSVLALVVLAPLLLCVSILLRFSGEGEVFFSQDRVGQHGKIFKLFKFATMLKDSPYFGTGTVTIKHDPRILPIGGFLRRSKINELPQLFNVLIGNMSLVGPRPQAKRCFNSFPMNLQSEIIKVKPGLSGVGSIIFRGEEDILSGNAGSVEFYENIISPYKGEVESWYVVHQDMPTYFLIIVITVWVVLNPRSNLIWFALKDLPIPPSTLSKALNYPLNKL